MRSLIIKALNRKYKEIKNDFRKQNDSKSASQLVKIYINQYFQC